MIILALVQGDEGVVHTEIDSNYIVLKHWIRFFAVVW